MVSLVVFVFGLAVGSFLNAFIYRLEVHDGLVLHPRGRRDLMHELLKGRSQCPSCAHTLAWQDLIPLLSFILLKGKCRHCKAKISFQYPLVELATGILFVLLLFKFHVVFPTLVSLSFAQILELLYLWTIASSLLVIFMYDLKHFIIPDRVLYPAILVSGIWYLVSSIAGWIPVYHILNILYISVGAAGFFLAIYLLSKGRAMGFGDVKLAFFYGFVPRVAQYLGSLVFCFFCRSAGRFNPYSF